VKEQREFERNILRKQKEFEKRRKELEKFNLKEQRQKKKPLLIEYNPDNLESGKPIRRRRGARVKKLESSRLVEPETYEIEEIIKQLRENPGEIEKIEIIQQPTYVITRK
jgi:hypothetical protein